MLLGTTLLLIATDAFQAYVKATHAVPDQDTGLLSITPEYFAILETLNFNIGDVSPLSRWENRSLTSPCFADLL